MRQQCNIPLSGRQILIGTGLAALLWACTASSAAWGQAPARWQDDPPSPDSKPAYTLSVSGACPGTLTIQWSGAGVNQRQGLIIGDQAGSTVVPGGQPCAGVVLGLAGHVRLVDPPGFMNTGDGHGSIAGRVRASVCGQYFQLLQGGDCQVSNVAPIPGQTEDQND